ncbi:EAL domain-containing protein [Candidatus Manganitrophus noduliformans]|uniref:EAL domain-containing protein n=1 Tax=Candidatus Manganitrophus noduliformans TaxID=2606439 RepID=A0A7X6DRI0_9BACT|nr:EAL domain-containing protein [Candidatus Manganitrophus noduliformans]NKE71839.1 EAL domain-containing protein [Candidatus Manganitrophus noduliformans]
MGIPLRVLMVEDSAEDAELLLGELRRGGYEPAHERVSTIEEMNRAIDRGSWDIVFGDYSMPHFDGVAALKLLRGKGLDIPFLFVSGTLGEDTAVKAMRAGANDYFVKGHLKRLLPVVERELRENGTRQERKRAEEQLRQSEERFRQLAENITEVFWMGDPDKNSILYISPGYEKIWGRSCESLYQEPKSFLDAVHPDDRERVMEASMTRQVSGTYDEEYRIIRPDGSVRWIRDRAFPIKDVSGRVYRLTGIAEDITRHKEAEEALRTAKEFSENLIETANVIILGLDTEGKVNIFNQTAEKITGYTLSELKGKSWFEKLVPKERYPSVWEEFTRLVSGGIPKTFENPILTKRGEERYILWQNNQVKVNGKIVATISFGNDITEHRQVEEMVQKMAFYDTLTGLPNRNMLIDRLLNALRHDAGQGRPMALLLMDLDRFREINDTLGHRRGDLLLQQLGERLRKTIFDRDIVAHFGGDEFAVLLMKLTSPDDIHLAVGKIVKALEAPFVIEDIPIAVETSIGIALYPDHGSDPDTLIRRADVAMYAAKETGRGHTLYAPELDRHSPQQLALMAELRQAISQNQLLLHYQPKIDLKRRAFFGVEALVRWRHPQRGMIPPGRFIGPAEQTGLIHPLTRWVVETAIDQCAVWQRAGLEMTLSANLSARNLQDPKLPESVAELLRSGGVAPERIQFEITESAIMTDPARAREVLVALHRSGIRFSIDDFGIGYSSLSYLRNLPVDSIKVDKSFVSQMILNEGDAKIVRSTIEMAHHLGLEVVAEGVETEEILERLGEMGCDAAQGYFISRPLPAEEVGRWLRESHWGRETQ